MFRSDDDVLRIDVLSSLSQAVFPAADCSVLPISHDDLEFKSIMYNLWNTPCDKHVTLLIPKNKRANYTTMLTNLASLRCWKFLEPVTLVYEKAIQSNSTSFIKLAEHGFLYYKGDYPNIEKTKWFFPEYANASNLWYLTPQPEEILRHTSALKFTWEIALLVITMASPLFYGRIIWGLDNVFDDNLIQFLVIHQIPMQIYVKTNEEAEKILNKYNSLKDTLTPRAIQARKRRKKDAYVEDEQLDFIVPPEIVEETDDD